MIRVWTRIDVTTLNIIVSEEEIILKIKIKKNPNKYIYMFK